MILRIGGVWDQSGAGPCRLHLFCDLILKGQRRGSSNRHGGSGEEVFLVDGILMSMMKLMTNSFGKECTG